MLEIPVCSKGEVRNRNLRVSADFVAPPEQCHKRSPFFLGRVLEDERARYGSLLENSILARLVQRGLSARGDCRAMPAVARIGERIGIVYYTNPGGMRY